MCTRLNINNHWRLFLLAAVILTGCSSGSFETVSFNLPEQDTHLPREDFRIIEPVSGAFIVGVMSVQVLENNNLIILNYWDQQLYELDPQGRLVDVIGQKGRGPGEFRLITDIYLLPGDSLHVIERNYGRHQVFAKIDEGVWSTARDRTFIYGYGEDMVEHVPEMVVEGPDNDYYGIFRLLLSASDTLNARYHFLSRVNHDLVPVGEMNRIRMESDRAIQRSNMATYSNARFLRGFYQYDPCRDEVIYITNVSNEIIAIGPEGHERVSGYLPYEHFPSRNDKENPARSMPFADRYTSEMKSEIERKLLPHEPYYWHMFLEGNRLWVHLARSDPEKPDWVITTLDGQILKSFRSPVKINSIKVHEDRMFVTGEDSAGVTYLAGYTLVEKENQNGQ